MADLSHNTILFGAFIAQWKSWTQAEWDASLIDEIETNLRKDFKQIAAEKDGDYPSFEELLDKTIHTVIERTRHLHPEDTSLVHKIQSNLEGFQHRFLSYVETEGEMLTARTQVELYLKRFAGFVTEWRNEAAPRWSPHIIDQVSRQLLGEMEHCIFENKGKHIGYQEVLRKAADNFDRHLLGNMITIDGLGSDAEKLLQHLSEFRKSRHIDARESNEFQPRDPERLIRTWERGQGGQR